MLATIALETGFTLSGRLFGPPRAAGGEVVFHTGMTGYQEILTDPSYAGQIVCFTASHIGNYGIHLGDDESAAIHPAAVVVRDHCRRSFHQQAHRSLEDVLRLAGIPGLADVDTRALTIQLREHGACRGVVGPGEPADLVAEAKALPPIAESNWVAKVSTNTRRTLEPLSNDDGPFDVAVLDCGIKRSILERLRQRGCRVHLFPWDTPAAELLAGPTDGVFLSNGPGDPATLDTVVATIRDLLKDDRPIFGICLGHQLLARALGGTTERLTFGHHGANHPVKRLSDSRVEITSQNHNYTVPIASLPRSARATHVSLNDGTLEGFELVGRPVYSIQFHPEAAPGPRDSHYLFDRFTADMRRRRNPVHT